MFFFFHTVSCEQIIFVEHPSNATLKPLDTTVLRCSFKPSLGECAWKRHGNVLRMSDRIHIIGKNTALDNVKNCSLQLVNVNQNDSGIYQCVAVTTFNYSDEWSIEAWITVKNKSSGNVIMISL